MEGGSKHYPLTIQRVKEIKKLNAQGIRPEELEAIEITSNKPKEVEPQFVDVVGQISLRSLEKNDRRRNEQRMRNNEQSGRNREQDFKNKNQPPQKFQQRPNNTNRYKKD